MEGPANRRGDGVLTILGSCEEADERQLTVCEMVIVPNQTTLVGDPDEN